MGRNPIDRYLTTCAPPHTVADIFPRNCAEVRILQDADENDVPSTTTDIPPDATSSSSSVAGDDVPAAAPVEEPAGVPSQNEGGASPPAGSHGKTIVGYYAVSSPAYFIVRSLVRSCRDGDCATWYCSFSLTFSDDPLHRKKSWQWYDRNNKASPESMDFTKVQRGEISSFSLCCRAQLVYIIDLRSLMHRPSAFRALFS